MHTASQALAIERQASAQPSLAERVSRPKTRAILGLMRLNFLSVLAPGCPTTTPSSNRSSKRRSTAPNSRRAASPAWTKPASGDSTSCTGTTSSTATAACATSPPPNGMPGKTMRSWRHGTRPIFKPANVTRRAGPGRHGTGHRSGPSRSTRNGTASFGTLPKLK